MLHLAASCFLCWDPSGSSLILIYVLARTCTLVSLSSQRQYTAHPRSFVNPRLLSLSFYLVLFVRSLARKLAHHSRFVQLGPRSLVPAQRLPAPLHPGAQGY